MSLKSAPVVVAGAQADSHSTRRRRRRLAGSKHGVAQFSHSHGDPALSVRVVVMKRNAAGGFPRLSAGLEEQILDLPVTAAEFGIPAPPGSLVEEVRRIVWRLQTWTPKGCLLYVMPDGTVAVDIRGRRPDGIFISIRDDGSAHCSGEMEGKIWRKTYTSSQKLPDANLLDELWRLRSGVSEE